MWGALLTGLGTTAATMGGGAMLNGLGIHPMDPLVQGIKGAIPKTKATLDPETGAITTEDGRSYGIDSPQAREWFGMDAGKFADWKDRKAKEKKASAITAELKARDASNTAFTRSTITENQNIARGTLNNQRYGMNLTADVARESQKSAAQVALEGLKTQIKMQSNQHQFDQPMQQAQIAGITGNLDIANRQQSANEKVQNWNMAQEDYRNRVQYALASNALDNQPRSEFIAALSELAGALVPTNINIRRR
jgi:hypothetical protein